MPLLLLANAGGGAPPAIAIMRAVLTPALTSPGAGLSSGGLYLDPHDVNVGVALSVSGLGYASLSGATVSVTARVRNPTTGAISLAPSFITTASTIGGTTITVGVGPGTQSAGERYQLTYLIAQGGMTQELYVVLTVLGLTLS